MEAKFSKTPRRCQSGDCTKLVRGRNPARPPWRSRPGCGFERRLAASGPVHAAGRRLNSQARTPAPHFSRLVRRGVSTCVPGVCGARSFCDAKPGRRRTGIYFWAAPQRQKRRNGFPFRFDFAGLLNFSFLLSEFQHLSFSPRCWSRAWTSRFDRCCRPTPAPAPDTPCRSSDRSA
jgi:hypothetical protein